MNETKPYETFDIPGVGELRARPGTSTAELAGAVKFWYDKCQSARWDGFLGGAVLMALINVCEIALYFYFR